MIIGKNVNVDLYPKLNDFYSTLRCDTAKHSNKRLWFEIMKLIWMSINNSVKNTVFDPCYKSYQ